MLPTLPEYIKVDSMEPATLLKLYRAACSLVALHSKQGGLKSHKQHAMDRLKLYEKELLKRLGT